MDEMNAAITEKIESMNDLMRELRDSLQNASKIEGSSHLKPSIGNTTSDTIDLKK